MIDKLKELLNNSRSDYFHFSVSAAIVTKDNRVLKAVVGKDNKDYIIEFDPTNGNKIGLVPKYEYINHKNNKKDINTEQNYILTEDDCVNEISRLLEAVKCR